MVGPLAPSGEHAAGQDQRETDRHADGERLAEKDHAEEHGDRRIDVGEHHCASGPDFSDQREEHDEREHQLADAIAELPPRQRSAIMLTYSEGMSNAQVAEILDTSVSAVETLLVRGKQNLRARLGNLIDGESDNE